MQTYQSAEITYNHESNIGSGCTPAVMLTAADDIAGELARMRDQGYVIHAVTVHTMCSTCSGSGRVATTRKVRGKGGKTVVKVIPYSFRLCPECKGHDGAISSDPYPVSAQPKATSTIGACPHCGSVLSAVTFTCVRGDYCPGAKR